jgi:hypothetical protein
MATDVLGVLRAQHAEAMGLVRRLEAAINALEGTSSPASRRRGRKPGRAAGSVSGKQPPARPRKAAAAGHEAAPDVEHTDRRKKRTISAATRAKMAAAQRARWSKKKG